MAYLHLTYSENNLNHIRLIYFLYFRNIALARKQPCYHHMKRALQPACLSYWVTKYHQNREIECMSLLKSKDHSFWLRKRLYYSDVNSGI